MIYLSDLQQLIASWTERMGDTSHAPSYRDALNDCIYELNCLIENTLNTELLARDYMAQEEADYYLSTIESHEQLTA